MKDREDKSRVLRKKAEELLQKRGGKDPSLYNESLESLVEELSIFQIELEQQNHEMQSTQEELEKTKEQFADLYHHAPVGYLTIDNQYLIKEGNQTCSNLLGIPLDELIDVPFTRFIHRDYQNTFYFHLRQVIYNNQKGVCELALTLPDEGELYVLMESIPNDYNNQAAIRSALIDKTERRQAEKALDDSETRLKMALEGAREGLLDWNVKTGELLISEQGAKLLGFDKEEIPGTMKEFEDRMHPEDAPGFRQALNRHLEGYSGYFEAETRLRDHRGEWLWVLNRGRLVERDARNNPVRALGTFVDIHKLKTIENDLKIKEFSISASINGLVIATLDQKLHYVNDAFLRLWGYENAGEVLGKDIREFWHDKAKVDKAIEKIQKEGHYRGEHKALRRNNQVFDAQVAISIAYDDKGNHAFYVASIIDITGEKQTKMELDVARQKAEESDRLKSAFLANMSHEIRTPLNAILGFVDLFEKNSFSVEQKRKFINIIKSNGYYLLQLINDIIDIAKIESNQLDMYYDSFDLHEMLMEVIMTKKNSRNFKRKGNVKLNCINALDHPFFIKSDEIRLKQILNNLLENSLKFTSEGWIQVGYTTKQEHLEFFVEDTGVGIPAEKLEIIFKRFGQANPENKKAFGGTGLGLSISKGLTHLLGGDIRVESEEGAGTTFYFTIAKVIPDTGEAVSKKADYESLDAYDLSEKTILVVEDEQSNFLLLEALLNLTSARIIRAETGYEAIEMTNLHPDIDLILMDIKMPGMDGFEATKHIKASRKVPVIAQTAHAFADDKQKALNAGCDDYIAKPIERQELMKKIMRFLDDAQDEHSNLHPGT